MPRPVEVWTGSQPETIRRPSRSEVVHIDVDGARDRLLGLGVRRCPGRQALTQAGAVACAESARWELEPRTHEIADSAAIIRPLAAPSPPAIDPRRGRARRARGGARIAQAGGLQRTRTLDRARAEDSSRPRERSIPILRERSRDRLESVIE